MTKIGVFDSGLGGLTVLSKLVKCHKAQYFYLGDNKRVPYGDRSKDEIIEYSKEIVEFLETFDIDFYLVACNTISVNAIDVLRENYSKEFISITEMGIKSALENEGDVLVLATKATILTHVYKDQIEKRSDKKVLEVPAPILVGLIEKGIREGADLDNALDTYLKEANENEISNILLGCTHYPIIENSIENRLTYEANIIDPADFLCENMTFKEDDKASFEIYMTNPNPINQKMASMIMGEDIKIKKADL